LKIDLHTHTIYGSACAYMDPDQLIFKAKSIGLDGVCITEHDHVWGDDALERLRNKHDYLIIGGVEVSTDCGEVLVFGLHEPVLDIYSIDDLKTIVNQAEGIMILAHPFRYEADLVNQNVNSMLSSMSSVDSAQIETISQNPVYSFLDAMETHNGRSGIKEKTLSKAVANHLNLPGTGGSDAHAVMGVGTCYTVFHEPVYSERDLIRQIKEGGIIPVDERWNGGKYEAGE
jgi:predicted metal-dependent phosphoesterase TrpH